MRPAGDYDRKIAFHAVMAAEDAMGGEVETVSGSPSCQAWALVLFGTGAERREAAAQGAEQTATFRVLSSAAVRAVTARDVIKFDGADWGISSIAPVGPQGSEIEFVATKRT